MSWSGPSARGVSSGSQPPTRNRASAACRSANSRTRADFPIPASPATSATRPPAAAAASRSPNSRSGEERSSRSACHLPAAVCRRAGSRCPSRSSPPTSPVERLADSNPGSGTPVPPSCFAIASDAAGLASPSLCTVARSRANSRQGSENPLRSRTPRSTNPSPLPAIRSRTVELTSTCPAPASAITRAARCTPTPATLPTSSSTSPVCSPARISMSNGARASTAAAAARTAWAGESKRARNPSPAVSTSQPPCAASTARIAPWWRTSKSAQAASPKFRRRPVDPTMSVNSSVWTRRVTATTSTRIHADEPGTWYGTVRHS
jgi:hypothetical protein